MGELIISDIDERLVEAVAARANAGATTVGSAAESLLRSALDHDLNDGYRAAEILALAKALPEDSTHLIRRDRDGVSENELGADEALKALRELRASALQPLLPDSTPYIRMDRDA